MQKDQAMRLMRELLSRMVEKDGSDLFITAGFPPAIKVDGKILPVSERPLTPDQSALIVRSIMNDGQRKEFDATKECNFAINPTGIGRFRVSAFVQQGSIGAVLRTINTTIPTLDSLGLPEVLKEVSMVKRGLVILVGGTGTGKSTSLAAMVDHRKSGSWRKTRASPARARPLSAGGIAAARGSRSLCILPSQAMFAPAGERALQSASRSAEGRRSTSSRIPFNFR